ncbi:hypothetical protein H6P81_004514 [Aristolochia fimbriata]|uniref:Uncharacterized protein n=1 Tax=Aristolochia fimbriata TaxID=158543 RepID=A0AAV7FHY9_ARIFI|nr:hypothetical protein H6P81_004514 [Aristolochia fimbriata]
MASDETMTVHSLSMHDEDEDFDDVTMDLEHDHHRYNMSRLSVCSGNGAHGDGEEDEEEEEDEGMTITTHLSRLSIEEEGWEGEAEGDADGELSEGKEEGLNLNGTDDSDKETIGAAGGAGGARGYLSMPSTPRRKFRRQAGGVVLAAGAADHILGGKEYASENEVRGGGRRRRRRRSQSARVRERWLERAWEMRKCRAMDEEFESGESECVVIARPKGGGKSLCMDLEEVKACRDLGFDLQHHQWTVEIPSLLSASTVDTDSGGNSPIANWRISSPGDDPRDVKARLKVWAQAVALASATRLNA